VDGDNDLDKRTGKTAEDVARDFRTFVSRVQAGVPDAPSPLVALAAIAARTKTIKLGSAIALAPLYHPVRFAEECAVLDILSNGRLEMALAVGYRRREAEAYGVDFSSRGRRTDEFLDIVRKLWAGETLSCQGKHFARQKCLGEVDDAHAGKRTCALRLRHFNGPSTAGVVSRRTLSGLPAHRRFDRHVPTRAAQSVKPLSGPSL